MSECDIHLTSDNEAVVFHDSDLKRLGGRPDFVRDLTAAQMLSYVNAPKLIDLLNDPQAPRLINIEVKSAAALRGDGLEEAAVKAVHAADASGRVIFSSFNPFALRRLAKIAPEIPRALLVSEDPDPKNRNYLKKMWLGFWARPHMLNLDQAMLTPERLERWNDRGLRVVAWTVNDAGRARALIEAGAHGVISDQLFTDEQTRESALV
jgi:glycerophosphoryl diester phosphodiesterase